MIYFIVKSKVLKATLFLKTVDKQVKDAKEQSKNSLNPIPFSEGSIRSSINRSIRKLKIELPITRQSLTQICQNMNLHISYL